RQVVRMARAQDLGAQRIGPVLQVRTGNPDHTDAAPAGRRGNGNDGVGSKGAHASPAANVGFTEKKSRPPRSTVSKAASSLHQLDAEAAFSRSSRTMMMRCWMMDTMLFTHQYSTRPAGNMNIIPPNTSGMIIMIFAWVGSGGVGFSLICRNIVAIMIAGRMNQGSRTDRSWTHRIQGAPRISTLPSSTQYSAMNTGICTTIGRQPPSGLIFSVRYISIMAAFSLALSSPNFSFRCCMRGATSFIFAIER